MSGFGSMITFETGSLKEREQDAEEIARVLAGRIAGRSGDADLASCHDDARGAGRERAQSDRDHGWHGPDFSWHRRRARISSTIWKSGWRRSRNSSRETTQAASLRQGSSSLFIKPLRTRQSKPDSSAIRLRWPGRYIPELHRNVIQKSPGGPFQTRLRLF